MAKTEKGRLIMSKEIEIITNGTFIDRGWKITTSIIRLFGDLMNEWLESNRQPDCLQYIDDQAGLQQAILTSGPGKRLGSARCSRKWELSANQMCLPRTDLVSVYGIIPVKFSRWCIWSASRRRTKYED